MIDDALTIALEPWLDNRGITSAADRERGEFNVWRNSFPAEELPPPGARVLVGGVPFVFPGRGPTGDNFRCARQLVELREDDYDWLYVLAAAEGRTEDVAQLHFAGGAVDVAWLRVSGFWPDSPAQFSERAAFRCDRLHYPRHAQHGFRPTIWRQRIAVTREAPLRAVRFPDNPALHVFALTAVARRRR